MGSNDNSLFVGFDFFAKQVEKDPQNPTAGELGLTSGSTRTPMTTNIADNVPDPAAHMGELNVRQGRVDEMQERMAEGIEAYSGHSEQESAKYQDPGDLTPEEFQRVLQSQGLDSEQAADYVEALRRQQSAYSPLKKLSRAEAAANARAESGDDDEWSGLAREAEHFENQEEGEVAASPTAPPTASSTAPPTGGAFGKSHDEMMIALSQAIGFMEKQQINPKTDVNAIAEVEDSWGGDPNVFTEEPEGGDGTELNESQQNWLTSQDKEDEDSNDINSQVVPRNVLEKLPETNRNEFNEPDTDEYGLELNESQQNWLAETEKRDEGLDKPRRLPQSEDYDSDTDSYSSENLSGDGFIKALGALIDGMENR